jgi:DNA-binding transcriptional ArsR family regulator
LVLQGKGGNRKKPNQNEILLKKLNNAYLTMDKEIRLSSAEFKALASETRAGIIRLLQQRNHTLTELSKKLSLAAPTIKQHLGILENAELIQGLDEGRKWKYYSLTRKGQNIFSQETPVNVFIVLGASIVALCGMIYFFLSTLENKALSFAMEQMPKSDAILTASGAMAPTAAPEIARETASSQWLLPDMQITLVLLGIIAVSLLIGLMIARVKN